MNLRLSQNMIIQNIEYMHEHPKFAEYYDEAFNHDRILKDVNCGKYLVIPVIERFSLDCRKTKTKVNTLANQRA